MTALTVTTGWTLVEASARRAAAQEADTLPIELASPQGATFVGTTSNPETLVGIVLLAAEPGRAVAYLCRSADLNIWFTGSIQDGALVLTGSDPIGDATPPPGLTLAEPAPTLRGRLTGDQITGEAELLGRTLTFTAIPAEGIAGLYVTGRDEGGGPSSGPPRLAPRCAPDKPRRPARRRKRCRSRSAVLSSRRMAGTSSW